MGFRCLAGTRAPWETHDTIAVLYVGHPLGPWVRRTWHFKRPARVEKGSVLLALLLAQCWLTSCST